MENIVYDIRWSHQIDEKFITDFRHVCSTVFHYNFTQEQFDCKFIRNIYGSSVLVVVYIDNKPAAARALWRNDIEGKEAYQPADTCVMENCRGKGVFSKMTQKSIELLPSSAIIYNFPNPNSFPGYLKMGWKLVHDYGMHLLDSYKAFAKEHPIKMDKEYADWWVKGRNIYYAKRFGHHFLVQKDRRPFCYRVLAEVEKEVALQFLHVNFGIFFYKSTRGSWYTKYFAASHVVSRCTDIEYIPTWKIDAI